jgi:hypothetical protein
MNKYEEALEVLFVLVNDEYPPNFKLYIGGLDRQSMTYEDAHKVLSTIVERAKQVKPILDLIEDLSCLDSKYDLSKLEELNIIIDKLMELKQALDWEQEDETHLESSI